MAGRKPAGMTPGDALLEKLAAEIASAKPRAGLGQRYGGWVLSVVGGILLLGIILTRPELGVRIAEPDFLGQIVFWGIVTLVAGACSFLLATPRWPMPFAVKWGLAYLGVAFMGYAVWLLLRMPPSLQHDASDMACMVIVSGIGIFTALSMTLILKSRAKPTYPALMALLMATAGAGAGMLAILFVCPHEGPGHVLVSHFLPALLVGGGLGWLGARWWRW